MEAGMARHDVEFDAEGVTLRGWFYTPNETSTVPAPCVVMAHGWSATRRIYLDRFAEVFAAARLAVLLYDHRGFGDSDAAPGKPRYEIDPWEQVRDYQHAITHAQNLPGVDADRIAVWGSSFSGAHAFVVAAIDQRVKAVCGQAPFVSGRATFSNVARENNQVIDLQRFADDRRARAAGAPATMIPVIGTDPTRVTGIPTPDAFEWFNEAHETLAPEWHNEVTLRSLELLRGYEPAPVPSTRDADAVADDRRPRRQPDRRQLGGISIRNCRGAKESRLRSGWTLRRVHGVRLRAGVDSGAGLVR
jgi:pimeloyl-ACP methyl ester carboxylesterase